MKIRNGFVSNSSSSSFVLLGIEVEPEDREKVSEGGLEDFGIESFWDEETEHDFIGVYPLLKDLNQSMTIKEWREDAAKKIGNFLGRKIDPLQVDFISGYAYD